jgi:hypothetical protein
MTDPDRQELVPVGGLQQHDRLLADQIEADPVDDHFLHRSGLVRILAQALGGKPGPLGTRFDTG